jgi:ribosomal peptide maturation radical SAM protein 1
MLGNGKNGQDGKTIPKDSIVLLVVPPFQGLRSPALSVSQLKANLTRAGIATEVLYLNMLFAKRITAVLHDSLSGTAPYLLGEFIFACAVHDHSDDEIRRYLDEILVGSELETRLAKMYRGKSAFDALRHLVTQAREFIRGEGIEAVLARKPWLVGLSSTFQSNCCSLAIIRELKRKRPEIVTLIGGANCEGEMGEEMFARYPDIDFLARGEADNTLVKFVQALQAGKPGTGMEGFLARGDKSHAPSSRPLTGRELDENAYPDFTDYFAQLAATPYRDRIVPGMPMETSRGCWWGMKQHCTFCGFNRLGMVYRSKNAVRAMDEMSTLMKQYGIPRIVLTDNILELDYFNTLLPEMAKNPDAELFAEIKVNLSREQIALLRRANFKRLQPGIESLSDKTLKLMKKGTTQFQNIQTLKWSLEYGIGLTWHWLFGFPGEDEGEIDGLLQVAKTIHHLEPPHGASVLYIERFAPYQTTPEKWDLGEIRAGAAYNHLYPFPAEALNRLAFYFDNDHFTNKGKGKSIGRLEEAVEGWAKEYPNSHLLALPWRNSLFIVDTRKCAKRFMRRISGLRKRLYEYCTESHSEQKILKVFESEAGADEIRSILKSFVADYLMLENNGRYLSLAADPQVDYKSNVKFSPVGYMLSAQKKRGSRVGRVRRGVRKLIGLRPAGVRFKMRQMVVKKLVEAALKRSAELAKVKPAVVLRQEKAASVS